MIFFVVEILQSTIVSDEEFTMYLYIFMKLIVSHTKGRINVRASIAATTFKMANNLYVPDVFSPHECLLISFIFFEIYSQL